MKKLIILTLILLSLSCNTKIAGTLGSGYVYEFRCGEEELNKCLDNFEHNSQDLFIPEKWKQYNNWNEIGYGFLKGKVFYFKGNSEFNEEMYFVSVLSSSFDEKNKNVVARTSIRAVFRMTENIPKWFYIDDISKSEAQIIENRFQKMVLNKMSKSDCNCKNYKITTNWPNQ